MKKIIKILILIILFSSSCKSQSNLNTENLELINLTEKSKGKLVFYKQCDANIEKFFIKKDTLIHTTHQDGDYISVIQKKIKIKKNEFLIIHHLGIMIDTIHLIKKNDLWSIGNRNYAEKKHKNKYRYIEQPCIECFSKEECNEEIKYITAKSGLIYRDKPKGKRLGKFKVNARIIITEHTNIFQEIKSGGKTIKGEWVGTKVNGNIVYVFSGFLSN